MPRASQTVADGMRGLRIVRAVALIAFLLGYVSCSVEAGSVFIRSYSFALDGYETNPWGTMITVDQYDPAWDVNALQQIDFVLVATLTGGIGVENRDVSPQTLSVVFDTTVSVDFSGRTPETIVTASPYYTADVDLGAYDGNTDYSGTSGASFAASASDTGMYSSPPPTGDLASFTGTGTLSLTITAAGNPPALLVLGATGKDPPSYLSNNEEIHGTLFVYYHTPEPSTLSMLGLLAVVAFVRRPVRSQRT